MSRHRPFLFLYSLLIFFLIAFHGVDSSYSSACSDIVCNGVRISYPFFWEGDERGNGTTNVYCGYQGLGLTCPDGNKTFPILALPTDSYYVKEIDYHNESLTLVDIDASNQSCPRVRHNVSLEELPLAYISEGSMNLSFYFNCTLNPYSNPALPSPILCLEEREPANSNYSYVFLERMEPKEFDWIHECGDKVVATVKQSELPAEYLNVAFGAAMNAGFVLDWEAAKNCGKCEQSGGRCGFNNRTKDSVCFCKNSAILTDGKTCPAGRKLGLKLGIAGAAVGVTALVMLVAFFLIGRYRNRRKPKHSYVVSRSISSDYSSRTDFEKRSGYFGLAVFEYDELKAATNNFDPEKELGDGGFGTVFYGKLLDGRSIAVKRLYENNYKRTEQFMNEVKILGRLHHPNLVQLYGCTHRHSHRLILVYEYVPNGTVADHLHGHLAKPGALPWAIRMNIAVETASALVYLHASDIIHRDVKTNNILLDENFKVKVADFGLSRLFPLNVTHVSTAPQGTPGYVDPEYHQCYQLTDKSDVYSFGVVLMELISSLPAVDIMRHRHEINLSTMAINKIQGDALHELVDPHLGFQSDHSTRNMITAVAELGFRCLQNGKDMRPSMAEVLKTLLDIQKQDKKTDKDEDNDNSDDAVLLKVNPLPLSPDSVVTKWVSDNSASNVSG